MGAIRRAGVPILSSVSTIIHAAVKEKEFEKLDKHRMSCGPILGRHAAALPRTSADMAARWRLASRHDARLGHYIANHP